MYLCCTEDSEKKIHLHYCKVGSQLGENSLAHCPSHANQHRAGSCLYPSQCSGEMLPLVSVVKQLVPTGLFSWISSGLRASSGFISLVSAPRWNRNSCALAAASCQPGLPADIISACLAMQPGRGVGGAARGERRESKILSVLQSP